MTKTNSCLKIVLHGYLDLVVVVDEAVSIARLIERFTISNAIIHYVKDSRFAIHEFVFILIFAFVAISRFIRTRTSKVTFNITWTMIKALKRNDRQTDSNPN